MDRQKTVSFEFEGLRFPNVFRVDLIVDRAVLVEVKSVPRLVAAHDKQLLTYRILDCRIGVLANFGAPLLKDGFKRIANGI